jgi:hypothetical protein
MSVYADFAGSRFDWCWWVIGVICEGVHGLVCSFGGFCLLVVGVGGVVVFWGVVVLIVCVRVCVWFHCFWWLVVLVGFEGVVERNSRHQVVAMLCTRSSSNE